MELLDALEETWSALHTLLAEVKPDEWDKPTPCAEWSVRDLAAHLGAVEGGFQGFPQPDPPAEWATPHTGIDEWTARGIAARRAWSLDDVLDETQRASAAQLARFAALDDDGWQGETSGPLGPTTFRGLAEIRNFDLYIHLLDFRSALGRPLAPGGEPVALRVTVDRAWQLSGWAAVKKAGLADGTRIRIELTDPAGRRGDLVVDGGRARVVDIDDATATSDRIAGAAAAYLLVATGRPQLADDAGGITATGPAAAALLEKFRLFS